GCQRTRARGPMVDAATLPPGVDIGLERVDGAAIGGHAPDRQPRVTLPSLGRAHAAPEVAGDLLPRVEATGSGHRCALGLRHYDTGWRALASFGVHAAIPAVVASTPMRGRWFFVALGLVALALATTAFAPSLLDGSQRRAPITPLVSAHAALMTSWLLLFLVQAWLGAHGDRKST